METEKSQPWVPAKIEKKLTWLDEVLKDISLSATAKNVATRLMRHHNDESGRCDPKQATLAEGVGRQVRSVSEAIRDLKNAGWISVSEYNERTCYVLNVDRTQAEQTEGGTRGIAQGYAERRVGGTRGSAWGVRAELRTGTSKRTSKGTSNPTSEPAAVASEPEADSPAKAQTVMPDQPEAKLSTPANDDVPVRGGRTFSGWTIPAETIRQWMDAFTDINLHGELVRRAPWFAANVPEKRRLGALASKLHKVNEEARQARLMRQENRQADATAGIKRDDWGRVIGAKNTSRFQL